MAALLSEDGRHRYWLYRDVATLSDGPRQAAVFVMLNPSTADAEKDDATIRKCCGFARRWGCSDVRVVNLWSFRATRPDDLFMWDWKLDRSAIADNEAWVAAVIGLPETALVVAAWGANAAIARKLGLPFIDVRPLARDAGHDVYCLGYTSKLAPKHPLLVPYAQSLVAYRQNDDF